MTTEHKIDISTLSTEQIQAEKKTAFTKANDILSGGGAIDDARLAEARKHFEDVEGLERELGKRREIDGLRTKVQGGLAGLINPAALPFGDGIGSGQDRKGRTPGQAFVGSELYQKHAKSGGFRHEPNSGNIPQFGVEMALGHLMEQGRKGTKGLLYSFASGGGAFSIPEYESGYEQLARPGPDILDLLSVQPTSADTVYWIRQDTRSTAATGVSQASVTTGTTGTKPESSLAFTRQSTPVETIAVWIAATNQQLADAPELQGIIDGELLYDLMLELDNQILNGSGTSPQLTGILNAGIQSVAWSSATYSNKADALFRAMVVIATANQPAPDGIVLNPLNWEPIRLLRESGTGSSGTGAYIMGNPMESGVQQLWGLPVVVSNRMTSGTGLVGSFKLGAKLLMREDSTVKIGMANDDFIRNIVRVLAELRAALTVRRPSAFAKVTSL